LFFELESETWLLRRFVKLNERFGMISGEEENGLIIPSFDLEEDMVDQEDASERDNEGEGVVDGGIRMVVMELRAMSCCTESFSSSVVSQVHACATLYRCR
jgi:hypothetical protein